MSSAELAESQERNDDASTANNCYFVRKRQGKYSGPFLKLHAYYRSMHISWEKCPPPWHLRLLPPPLDTKLYGPAITSLYFGWQEIRSVLVLKLAGRQHTAAFLCESSPIPLEVITPYPRSPTHLASSFRGPLLYRASVLRTELLRKVLEKGSGMPHHACLWKKPALHMETSTALLP